MKLAKALLIGTLTLGGIAGGDFSCRKVCQAQYSHGVAWIENNPSYDSYQKEKALREYDIFYNDENKKIGEHVFGGGIGGVLAFVLGFWVFGGKRPEDSHKTQRGSPSHPYEHHYDPDYGGWT